MQPEEWKIDFVKVRIVQNVRLIPKELIENVKGRTFTPEQFYKFQETQIANENPGDLLYLLVDSNKMIVGYLWMEISQIDKTLFINTFSIDKSHWYKGKAIPFAVEFIRKLNEKLKCPRVLWITTNDRFFAKYGFKRSKHVIMEHS